MTLSSFFFTFIAATLMADLRAQSVPLDAAGYTDVGADLKLTHRADPNLTQGGGCVFE